MTYLDAASNPLPALSVGYIFDPNYDRISSMTDGNGVTNYSYNSITNPPVALGEGKLASVSGPSGNQPVGYTISYGYDELGRRLGRTVGGAANSASLAANTTSVVYDALGRVNPTSTNVLGSFGYSYVGQTTRLDHITYPNSQQVDFGYDLDPTHDRQLLEIKNLDPVGAVLSKFDYTHVATGRIQTWTQSNPTLANPQQYTFGYDGADQLQTANLTDTGSGATLALSAYSYDLAGNRQTAQSDNNVSTTTYNFPFQMQLDPGGLMYFSGALNENATLTIGGQAATVTPNPGGPAGQTYLFSGWASVNAGANTVPIVATEADVVPGLNPKVTSEHIQLTVANFATQTASLDSVGNMGNDFQLSSFQWDAANRLATITSPPVTAALTYDGLGRRVKMVQSQGGAVTSELHYVWDGMTLVEERDASNQVTKRYFAEGEQRVSAGTTTNYFYTRDHLGSLREMTDQAGVIHARYSYDPWGQRTKQSGDLDADFGFTGHFYHAPSQLHLAPYRAYSANLGRWLSRDSLGERGGINLYEYCLNDPVNNRDSLGNSPADVAKLTTVSQGLITQMTVDDQRLGSWTNFVLEPIGLGVVNSAVGALIQLPGDLWDAAWGNGLKTYQQGSWSCQAQSQNIEDRLSPFLQPGWLDATWTTTQVINGSDTHVWIQLQSSDANDPVIIVDPWKSQVYTK